MKTAIKPGFSELIIIVNPTKEVTREGMVSIYMPELYAPWADLKERGIFEMTFKGDTLRALATELSNRYRKANVDFEVINPRTNDVDLDYDILVNGKNYVTFSGGLDMKLKDDDTITLKVAWRWDG